MTTLELPPTALNEGDPDDGDQGRQLRGALIAAQSPIKKTKVGYQVPSQSGNGSYIVDPDPVDPYCNCPDFELRDTPCKHIIAATMALAREQDEPDEPPATEPTHPQQKQKKTTRNHRAYNQAKEHEEEYFGWLLRDLCNTVEQPDYHFGRPKLYLGDMVHAAALKVYSLKCGRKAMSSIRRADAQDLLEQAPSRSSVMHYLQKPELTPLLRELVVKSALPLAAAESVVAIDSSGFATGTYNRWFDKKHKRERKEARWLKLHLMCGVKTKIITSVAVTESNTHDTVLFKPLLEETARYFNVEEVSADKAYLSKKNLYTANALGIAAYIPFKVNSTGDHGHHKPDPLWRRAYHYYQLHRQEFLEHYHQRSNSETAFSMVKANFWEGIKAKSETAQINEVLVKALCHNICVLVQSIFDLELDPQLGALSTPTQELIALAA